MADEKALRHRALHALTSQWNTLRDGGPAGNCLSSPYAVVTVFRWPRWALVLHGLQSRHSYHQLFSW